MNNDVIWSVTIFILCLCSFFTILTFQNSNRINAIEKFNKTEIVYRHFDEDKEIQDIQLSRDREDKLLEAVKQLSYETDVLTQAFKNQK